jgi:hypothetical protein
MHRKYFRMMDGFSVFLFFNLVTVVMCLSTGQRVGSKGLMPRRLAAVLLLLCVHGGCEAAAFAPGLPLRRPLAACRTAAACRQARGRRRARAAAARGEVRMAMHGREMTERSEAVQVWHASARGALRALAPQRHTEFAA